MLAGNESVDGSGDTFGRTWGNWCLAEGVVLFLGLVWMDQSCLPQPGIHRDADINQR